MATHELKILPEYYDAVALKTKTFEIRKNDRNFHVGDELILREWDGENYTGRELKRYVSYVLYDWQAGLKDGYCIMSIKSSRPTEVLDDVQIKECCATCNKHLYLEKWDYTNDGVPKTKYDGFACLAFADEGLVIHMVGGISEDDDMCEMYSERC